MFQHELRWNNRSLVLYEMKWRWFFLRVWRRVLMHRCCFRWILIHDWIYQVVSLFITIINLIILVWIRLLLSSFTFGDWGEGISIFGASKPNLLLCVVREIKWFFRWSRDQWCSRLMEWKSLVLRRNSRTTLFFLIIDIFVNIFNYGRRNMILFDQTLSQSQVLGFFWNKWLIHRHLSPLEEAWTVLAFHHLHLLIYNSCWRLDSFFASHDDLCLFMDVLVWINVKFLLDAVEELLGMASDLRTGPGSNVRLNLYPILAEEMHCYRNFKNGALS